MGLNYCFQNNADFTPLQTLRGRGIIRKKYDSDTLRELLENPGKLFKDAEIFKDSRTTKAGIVHLKIPDVTELFIKSFNNKGFIYTVRYIFREPRPFRVWRTAWKLQQAGIPTPEPIAAIAEFSWGFIPGNAYLIRNVVPDIVSTLEFFREMLPDDNLRKSFIQSALKLFAGMHNAGIFHGDAKCSNIYICKKGEDFSYGVWDLLSCRIFSEPLKPALRTKEIARFADSFAEIAGRLNITLPDHATKKNILEMYNGLSGNSLKDTNP